MVKDPIRGRSPKGFYTVKLETEPETWCTIEDLGFVLIQDEDFDHYWAYVVNEQEERASTWMMQPPTSFVSLIVKYEDEFCKFGFCFADYGLEEGILSLAVVPLIYTVTVWSIFALGAYLSHKQRTPLNKCACTRVSGTTEG